VPSQVEHIQAARSNEDLADHLLSRSNMPWAVVAAFYSALHWVDSHLAKQDLHPRNHTERFRMVALHLEPIYHPYRTLSDRSREARYDLLEFAEEEVKDLIQVELAEVKAYVQSLP
jgi:uncharacterized protein (UPF0332 family)